MQGTIFVFLSEALFPLTGIITAAYLTRSLGAGNYGMLTLAATLVSWIQFAVNSFFSRATVKIIGDAEDWQPIGSAILRLHVSVGAAAMIVCWMLAYPVAKLLDEPRLAMYLALFAIDLPIFAAAYCHRNILVGKGRFAERAKAGAGRWIARLVLIILLVELGLSVQGAILGSIGASLVELAIARYHIRPRISNRAANMVTLLDYAVPIFLASMSLRLLGVDLFLLKILGLTAAQVGIYGAAQNISFVMPGVLSVSLAPLLLSTTTRVLKENDPKAARILGRNAIRTVIAVLPFAVVAAAVSDEIAVLLFGAAFSDAGPIIAILVFAGLAMMLINLLNAILVSYGNPSWVMLVAAPLLPTAIIGHLFAIPRFGLIGAASVTAFAAVLGAIIGLIAVWKRTRIPFPLSTLLRAILLSGIVYSLAHFWTLSGAAIVAKIAIAMLLIAGGFIAFGEFRQKEILFLRSIIQQNFKNTSGKS